MSAATSQFCADVAGVLGARLREIGMTLEELARDADLPQHNLAKRMANGNFDVSDLLPVTLALGLSMDEFLRRLTATDRPT